MKIDFNKNITMFALIFFMMILPVVRPAGAATFCVSDATGLQSALTQAASNGEDDIIKIQQATYVGNFVYASFEANVLTIEGGYTSGCDSRSIDPANTVLDGNGTGNVLAISTDKATPAKIKGITFQNGVASNGLGGGIYFNTDGGSLEANGCVFDRNSASAGGGVYTYAGDHGTIALTNNTFTGNSASDGGGGVSASTSYSWSTLTFTLTNNTFTGNSASAGGGVNTYAGDHGTIALTNNNFYGNQATTHHGGAICTWLSGTNNTARIYNNILCMNTASEGADLWINNDGDNDFLPSPVELLNNDFDQSAAGTYIKIPFPIDPSNLNKLDPLFVDAANGDLHLSAGSPCIDSGDNDAPGLPSTDKDGNPRIFGGIVDMGAYEYQEILYVDTEGLCGGNLPCYTSIHEAISTSGSTAIINISGVPYNEGLTLNQTTHLTLRGGWDSSFTTQSSYTTVTSMTISNGTIVPDRIILK